MTGAAEVYRDHPTTTEVDDVMALRTSAALATLEADGSPHLAYVIFLYENGHAYFETASITRKARNLARDGRAALLVQGTASSGRHLMVSISGPARLLSGDEAEALKLRLRSKYVKPEALDDLARAWDRFDDVVVAITAATVRTWTGSVFHAETQAGLAMDYDDIWIDD